MPKWMERALERSEAAKDRLIEQMIKEIEKNKRLFDTPVEDLGMSMRTANLLRRAGYKTVRDVYMADCTEILACRGVGIITLREICDKFREAGLLKARLEQFVAMIEINPGRAKRNARKQMKG